MRNKYLMFDIVYLNRIRIKGLDIKNKLSKVYLNIEMLKC